MIVVWCLFVHFICKEWVFVVWGECSSPDDWQDSLKDIWCRSHCHEVISQYLPYLVYVWEQCTQLVVLHPPEVCRSSLLPLWKSKSWQEALSHISVLWMVSFRRYAVYTLWSWWALHGSAFVVSKVAFTASSRKNISSSSTSSWAWCRDWWRWRNVRLGNLACSTTGICVPFRSNTGSGWTFRSRQKCTQTVLVSENLKPLVSTQCCNLFNVCWRCRSMMWTNLEW